MRVEGFLKVVLETKKEDLARARSEVPLNTLRRQAESLLWHGPGFFEALKTSGPEDIGIIAEIKKASPAKGDIRPDLDPARLAEDYAEGGARAISVLTETRYFKGSLKDLEIVVQQTGLPVLRKDFTISEYQIYESRRAGASAVLLITAILSADQLRDYIQLSQEIGMDPLVEIFSEKELEIAYEAGARLISINNRDLRTLETDPAVSGRIAAILPEDVIPVAASGIQSFRDVQKGIAAGIFNFLVGESLVRAKDPVAFVRELRNAV